MASAGLRFVDLFSGLGGFHNALSRLGHECVFACEIDQELRNLYFLNFGVHPSSDIRTCWSEVPPHDILCAGFPCQPFSKAGEQMGFLCPIFGDLYEYILKILDRHRPKFLIFENVPNILRHSNGKTWRTIRSSLEKRGYFVESKELSPHLYGVPQIRNRAIIVGKDGPFVKFQWPTPFTSTSDLHVSSILDNDTKKPEILSSAYLHYLEVWEEFLNCLTNVEKMPSFPIWAMEFGATYPFHRRSPMHYSTRYLARFNGAFGQSLSGKSREDQIAILPVYSRVNTGLLPGWKKKFIAQNREFYARNIDRLDGWLSKVQDFPSSFQKFEWNWQHGRRTVWDKIIQFRASGIRVKNPATAPSLVALTTSQIPIVAWERRYMNIRECAKLQNLDELRYLPKAKTKAFRALGNAVNAKVIYLVAKNFLLEKDDDSQISTYSTYDRRVA